MSCSSAHYRLSTADITYREPEHPARSRSTWSTSWSCLSPIKLIALKIEQRVTEEVAALISRRGRYKVVTSISDADAVLEGAVSSYLTNAVQFGSSGRATRVEAVVQIQATLRETATDSILWSQAGLIFREQFDVPDTGAFFDQETLALDDIARGVANTLVNSIFEGF